MLLKYDIIGKTFKDKSGNTFKVECVDHINDKSIKFYKCVYESGWITITTSGHVRAGEIKDMFSPSVFGVGCLGFASGYATRKGDRTLYYMWRAMIRRCYDVNYKAYKWYGEKGITVCERWKRLDYFIEDVSKIKGYNFNKIKNGKLELDKDIINRSLKIYSLETCCFVSHSENVKESLKRRYSKV